MPFRQREEMVAIAGDQERPLPACERQNRGILCVDRDKFSQPARFVPGLLDYAGNGVGNVVIQQEGLSPASAICRATR